MRRLLVLLLGLLTATLTAFAGWEELPNPATDNLTSLSFSSVTTGTVAGIGGMILRTTDGGASWTAQTGIPTIDYFGVAFANDTAGVLVGGMATILRTSNGGSRWDTVQTDFLSTYFAVDQLNATVAMAVGGNTLFSPFGSITFNNWLTKTDFVYYLMPDCTMTGGTANDVVLLNDSVAVAVNSSWDNQGAITRTVDSGQNWATLYWGVESLAALDFPTPLVGYAVGESGIVVKSIDGGVTWDVVAQTGSNLWGVSFVNADTGWAVGDFSRILHTTNGGISWAEQFSALFGAYKAVQFVDDTTGYVVGTDGRILKTTDAGGQDNLPPGEFTRLLPVDSSQAQEQPVQFAWSAATDPDSDSVAYRFQMWAGDGFPLVWDTVTAETTYAAYIDIVTQRTLVPFHWRVTATDGTDSTRPTNDDGLFYVDIVSADESQARIESYALAAYPNPFNPLAEIRYALPQSGPVTLAVYDVLGREVALLEQGCRAVGEHRVTFDAGELPSGLYFARLSAGTYHATQKLVLLK